MIATVFQAGAGEAGRPAWLAAFERRRLAPRQGREVLARGRTVLVYVVDGVMQLRHGEAALDRALPGELVCACGLESLEFANGSNTEPLEVCEWALTDARSGAQRVEQRYFSDDDIRGTLCEVACAAGTGDALAHGGDCRAFLATLGKWETVLHNPAAGASNWLHVFEGTVNANGADVAAGSSAWLQGDEEIRLSGSEPASLLLLEGPDPAGD